VSDAWAIRALYVFAPDGGFLGGVDTYLAMPNIAPRPLQAVYFAAQNALFGPHMGWWLAWQTALAALMSGSLYALLRLLDFRRLEAGAVSALVLIFPAATSIRLWVAPASQLAISLALAGFALALCAFRAHGRRRLTLHALSLTAFASSLLLYEAMLPLMLASVLLYRLRVPWEAAIKRWGADCVLLIPLVVMVTRSDSSEWETQSAAGTWDHATVFWDQAQTLLATVLLPFGTDDRYALALVALVPAVALIALRRLDPADPARAELRRWLGTIAGGLVVIALGYSIFLPAIDYYMPLGPGLGNRVNAVPSIGWVLLLYGTVALAATMAGRALSLAPRLTSQIALAACVVLSVGWLQAVSRDASAFARGFEEGQRVLQAVRAAVPEPAPSSTIWTFGQPAEIELGVPVFSNVWDMAASVQLMYGDQTLRSFVAFAGTTFACGSDRMTPGGRYEADARRRQSPFASRYGRTYFVDTTSGRWERIDSRAQCRAASSSFPPAPGLPPATLPH
jgi:hypothetical protein